MKSVGFAVGLMAWMVGCSDAGKGDSPSPSEPKRFAWVEVTPCPVPRFEALGVVVAGELWVMGGFLSTKLDVTRRIDIYDPRTDSWRLGPELPGAETHAGVANVGEDFVLVGGFIGNVLDRVTTAGMWRWNAASASFVAGPDLPAARAGTATALVGSTLHVAGGLAEDGNTDTGDHFTLELASGAGWATSVALPTPRNHGGGAASGGLFYAVAGRFRWDETSGHVPDLHAFEPRTSSWQARAPMPLGRSEIGASTLVLSDGRLLTVGGSVFGKKPSDEVLVYDPRADVWSALAPLPRPLKGAIAARIGDQIIVSSGSPTSTDPSAMTYVGCCL